MADPLRPAIPAATLVIFRDAPDGGAPQLLMVERARAMAFAGGALVFPGGRVDAGDRALAASGVDADEDAHRIAAIRETIEEVGLGIGLQPPLTAAALQAVRAALASGTTIGDALAAVGIGLQLADLVPFARWRPNHAGMRIFDTRFYLARLPADTQPATVDGTENSRLLWASADQVLADADAGRAAIIFPTRRNLERLAQFASFDEAAAAARAVPVRTITPFVEQRGGRRHLCIPSDCGYPVTSEPMDEARRG